MLLPKIPIMAKIVAPVRTEKKRQHDFGTIWRSDVILKLDCQGAKVQNKLVLIPEKTELFELISWQQQLREVLSDYDRCMVISEIKG